MRECFVLKSSRECKISRLFTFLAKRAFCVLGICKPVEILPRGGNSRFGNGVVSPLAVLTPLDNAAVTEYFHMVRERRLSDVHFFKQLTSALFAAFQHLQYLNAVFIAECFEDNGGAFGVNFHLLHLTFTNFYLYYMQQIEKFQYINCTNIYDYFFDFCIEQSFLTN